MRGDIAPFRLASFRRYRLLLPVFAAHSLPAVLIIALYRPFPDYHELIIANKGPLQCFSASREDRGTAWVGLRQIVRVGAGSATSAEGLRKPDEPCGSSH
jgi:hypothetical protein